MSYRSGISLVLAASLLGGCSPQDGGKGGNGGGNGNAHGPTLALAGASTPEGNSGSHALQFRLTLSEATEKTVRVRYATQDGTAIAGQDYDAASGELNFPAGTTEQSINVTVRGDTAIEPDEAF